MVNQTTMLASESKEFARRIRQAMLARDGEVAAETSFRDFDTICPATQDNQDAVQALAQDDRADVFLVLGGYDSSNTKNLLMAAHARRGKYHVQQADSIGTDEIRHRDPVSGEERVTPGWLPEGEVRIDLVRRSVDPRHRDRGPDPRRVPGCGRGHAAPRGRRRRGRVGDRAGSGGTGRTSRTSRTSRAANLSESAHRAWRIRSGQSGRGPAVGDEDLGNRDTLSPKLNAERAIPSHGDTMAEAPTPAWFVRLHLSRFLKAP